MGRVDDDMLNTLTRYKELAQNKENQAAMVKDTATVQFLVYALEGTSSAVKDTAMATLELLSENPVSRTTLRNIFGVMEALESVSNSTSLDDSKLSERARQLYRRLEEAKNLVWQVPKSVTISVPDMHSDDCSQLWQAFSSVPGVISCNFNVEHRHCVLTVFSSMNPQLLVQVVRSQTGMEAEVYRPGNQSVSKDTFVSDLPSYLPEEDSPIVQKKAVSRRRTNRRESGWFTRATSFVVESLFW